MFLQRLFPICLLTFSLFFSCSTTYADDSELAKIVKTLPRPANSIAYLNFPALQSLMSDKSQSEPLSKHVQEVWIASELDLVELQPKWEIGTVKLKKQPSIEGLVSATNGYVDSIRNREVVWSSRNTYLIPKENQSLDFVRPADRQLTNSWLEGTTSNNNSLFLAQSTQQSETYLSLMIAIDIENYLSPVQLNEKSKSLKSLAGLDLGAVNDLFATVKGISIIVGRRSLQECIITLEFGKSPDIVKEVAPALLAEILANNQSALPEVAKWKSKVDKYKLSLQGPIDESTLSSLIGIFSVQDQAEDIGQRVSNSSQTTADSLAVDASKEYFTNTVRKIEGVRNFNTHFTGERAKWNDQTARKIDAQPTLNVAPELVEYGANVARLLRGNSLTIRQANIAKGVNQASINYGNNYYSNGTYGFNSPSSQYNYVDAQGKAVGNRDYRTILSEIDQYTADIRRAMTAKFGVQF